MTSITELHFFKRQASGPKPEAARKLQIEGDNLSAIATLTSLRLSDSSIPADAVVVHNDRFSVVHDPFEMPIIESAPDGGGYSLQHTIQRDRKPNESLIDILTDLVREIKTDPDVPGLPVRMCSKMTIFDRTTHENPLGLNGNGYVRRSWGVIKAMEIDGTSVLVHILNKKLANQGTLDWAK